MDQYRLERFFHLLRNYSYINANIGKLMIGTDLGGPERYEERQCRSH